MDISYETENWKIISWVYTVTDIKRMLKKGEITSNDYDNIISIMKLAEEENLDDDNDNDDGGDDGE